jgi:undecaprenyl-diphosphatase
MNVLIIFAAKYLIALPVLVLLAYVIFSRGKALRQLLWLSALSLPVAYALGRLAGLLYNDPRPFVVGHFTPLVAHAADNGFPSDHALFAATLAMIVLYADMRSGVALWIVAILIGATRVLAGVHHTTDIVASMLIAIVAVLMSQFIIARLRRL